MDDRELLRLAAKAIGGGEVVWTDIDGNRYCGDPERPWNPLTDDGDALRLALKFSLGITFDFYPMRGGDLSGKSFRARIWCIGGWIKEEFDNEEEKPVAVRRAIVRAAAEIGKQMP